MRLVDDLREEHRLIDQIAGSLFFWADRGSDHPNAENDLKDLVHFLRIFLHGFHHHREEVLFRALEEHGEVPGHHGADHDVGGVGVVQERPLFHQPRQSGNTGFKFGLNPDHLDAERALLTRSQGKSRRPRSNTRFWHTEPHFRRQGFD